MMGLVATDPADTVTAWMVHLRAELPAAGRPAAGGDDLEPMVELMMRTEGVQCVAAVPLESGLAVAVGLSAADASTALDRARALLSCCARYAGLGEVIVRRVDVTPGRVAGTA